MADQRKQKNVTIDRKGLCRFGLESKLIELLLHDRIAGMKTDLFEPELLADYLLYRLNLREVSGSSHGMWLS